MRFVTAVFGEGHRQAGLALERTFSRSNRGSDLTGVRCGNGLEVPGERYAISGMFSVPPGPALEYLETVTRERPS